MRRESLARDIFRQYRLLLRRPTYSTPDLGPLNSALEILDSTGPQASHDDSEDPIFIFATSWRSGSTLLQRILCTDRSLLLWGEPLGRLALLPKLTAALSTINPAWPPPDYWCPAEVSQTALTTTWIANLYPVGSDVHRALREFILHWLALPARRMGRSRWGFKEVRLGVAEARLLAWLFPKAKFVVLVRHPFDAYRSVSRAFEPDTWWHMYSRWPDIPMSGAASFSHHWNWLTSSWLGLSEATISRVLVRYEDLLASEEIRRRLADFLGLRVDEQQALAVEVGRTPDRSPLRAYERVLIRRICSDSMRRLAYGPEGSVGPAPQSIQF